MVDYSQYETASAEPEAGSMIETFRAIGYNLETAVADIIDNSISAGAKNIWIDFDYKGTETWFSIKDDGRGMDNTELIHAMRPGSKSPNKVRNVSDLGRFGLGLKTASFSQCRKLTVISKSIDSGSVYWTWDLDYVSIEGKWNLLKVLPEDEFLEQLNKLESGTIVIWNDLDRLVKSFNQHDKASLEKFLRIMDQVKKHLAMIFHRFIEEKKIKLWFRDREVTPWNPFLIGEPGTQQLPDEPLQGGKVRIKGYILPHKSRLTTIKFTEAEGPNGWNAHQGFYIYRNKRLLLAGDWLGLFKKEEHVKLARISVDIPNNLDEDWQIDIKKSVARPPVALRDQLKAYANTVRARAVEVYRHKGKVLKRKFIETAYQPVWVEKLRNGKRFYEINREHPHIQEVLEPKTKETEALERTLKFIEETVPVPLITLRENENIHDHGKPFEGIDSTFIKKEIKKLYDALIIKKNSSEQAKAIILNIEPYDQYPELIEYL